MAEQDDLRLSIQALTGEIRLLRDELVRKDVYDADERRRDGQLRDVRGDIEDIKRTEAEAARERRADRRVLYGALAASICTVIVNFYTQARGGT